ncbi:hypothetical protein [Bacillus cereus]|uniref:Uncharacterized protein n=1 Tax=Bacillus cereus TaxID=1396 RepID=A0A9X6WVD3_BACCE|nr:hypothetical protein [Bacillus cereus]PFK07443.1 hypothetical protein COI98_27440 [Bacillus cereus]
MVRVYPHFHGMVWEAAQKWAEANGLLFQTLSYADPLTNADTISLHVNFTDIGCSEECVELEKIRISKAFANNTEQQRKETWEDTVYVEDHFTWENEYQFVLPGHSFLTIPRVPASIHKDIHPGFLVNLFGMNQRFDTKMREQRSLRAELFLEPSSSATIQLKVEKQCISQSYQVELFIQGSIIVTTQNRRGQQHEHYVGLIDIMPFFRSHTNFSWEGQALIFREKGKFTGILSRAIRAYVTQTLYHDGKTLEYEIPLLRTSEFESVQQPMIPALSNSTTHSQQSIATNSTSCGCPTCMSTKSNENLYTD